MQKRFSSTAFIALTKTNTARGTIYFCRGRVNVVFLYMLITWNLAPDLTVYFEAGFIYPGKSTPKTQLIVYFYISLPLLLRVFLRDTKEITFKPSRRRSFTRHLFTIQSQTNKIVRDDIIFQNYLNEYEINRILIKIFIKIYLKFKT